MDVIFILSSAKKVAKYLTRSMGRKSDPTRWECENFFVKQLALHRECDKQNNVMSSV
jgi:hypothetical protein